MSVSGLSLSSGINSNLVALELWDDEALHLLPIRQVQAAATRAHSMHLQFALQLPGEDHWLAGDLSAATL